MNAKIVGLILGILVTPATLFYALISAGGGHGDYLIARVLYPIPMIGPTIIILLASLFRSELIFSSMMLVTPVVLVLACVQFAIYGWLAGAAYRYEYRKHGLVILVLHVVATLILFIVPSQFGR